MPTETGGLASTEVGRRRCAPAVPLLAVLALAACGPSGSGSRAADEPKAVDGHATLILHDASIWTGNADQPSATAIAIAGTDILAVGTDAEILPLATDDTRILDLDGSFVTPGFSDNHTHFQSAARFLDFNIMAVDDQAELLERLRATAERLEAGEWITGGLWGAYDQWRQGSAGSDGARQPFTPALMDLEELDRHPIFLTRFDGAEYAANATALLAAGLDPEGPDPEGIELVRDQQGRFTGILHGPGVSSRFADVIPEPSRDRRLEMTRNALAEIRRRGVTNISDMSDDLQLELFRELHDENELTVRVHFRYPLERWPELQRQGIAVGSGHPWIRLGCLKGHIDGIMGNSTARFFEPYDHDPTNRGSWRRLMVDDEGNFVEGQFLDHMLGADAAGLQLSIHAIGDEANALLLDYLEQLEERNGARDRRFRLVHAQVIAEKDFDRLGELDVVAEVQPFHLADDMRWMEERIGRQRSAGAYAFGSIRDAGATLSFGSDWPGTAASEYPIDPLRGLYAAVTRRTTAGTPTDGWFPDQRLTIEEALRAYTWGSTWANFEEEIKGTLEPGKLADLTVLDRDLLTIEPEELLDVEVLYTIVDGRVVYETP